MVVTHAPDTGTILAPLREHAERHPDKLLYAFLDREGRLAESYTYAGFLQRTAEIAAHVARTHPLAPGARVLLVYPPGLEMICAFFACVRLGVIPVPVYPPASQGFAGALYRLDYIARDCGAEGALTDRSYFWSLKVHRARTRIASLSFGQNYSDRLRWIVTGDAERGVAWDDRPAGSGILFLQYTSGSTRDPKGVMVTHQNVLQNCASVIDHLPVGVSWLPQYHDLGLIGSYLFMGLRGGTTYGFSPIDFLQRPWLWLEAISRYRATISAAPNFAYAYCLRREKLPEERLQGIDLSSLEVLMNCAEPVRAEVVRKFQERFAPFGLRAESFFASYGLAEYTLAVSSRGRTIRAFDRARMAENEVREATASDPDAHSATLVSCGMPLESTVVRIVRTDGSGRAAPDGTIGEVWVSGPSACLGYWNRPELTRETFAARIPGEGETPWLRTGDLGFLLDGELFICGRIKDLIILRGANYYPQDIEAIVEEESAIRRGCVAAFGVEEGGEERLVVVAELRHAKRLPDTDAVNRRISSRLGIGANRFVYVQPRTIPKTSSGKIRRHQASARWMAGELAVVAQVETTAQAFMDAREDSIADGVAPSAAGAELPDPLEALLRRYGLTGSESATLGEAGLDSLAITEFAFDLQNALKALGADDLAGSVDILWLQKIAVSELVALLRDVAASATLGRTRFRQAFMALQREHEEVERELMRRDARLSFEIGPLPLTSPVAPGEGGGILLTGGTGFFGPFLLQSLLEQTDDPLYVLVRARDPRHGMERLREGLLTLGPALYADALVRLEARVTPVCGDLSRPKLGLPEDRWRSLSEGIHTIYHNGALVNYLLDYASLRDVNVGSTNEVVRLAVSGRAKVVNHISSTFIFGWSTKATLFEADRNEAMELLDFGYSQTKWVAEQVVFDALRQGVPARVFRPALITPSVSGGGQNFDIAIRLLAFMLKHGIGTTAGNQVSFSPADQVAHNIVAIATLPETVGKTFHVTRDSYANMQDITGLLAEITGRRFEHHTLEDFVPEVIARCRKDDLLFPLLDFLVRSVENITAMEFKRYCNRNYREARDRSPRGAEDASLREVVEGIVRFMRRHGIADADGEGGSIHSREVGHDHARR